MHGCIIADWPGDYSSWWAGDYAELYLVGGISDSGQSVRNLEYVSNDFSFAPSDWTSSGQLPDGITVS